jgi:hypothetical protein
MTPPPGDPFPGNANGNKRRGRRAAPAFGKPCELKPPAPHAASRLAAGAKVTQPAVQAARTPCMHAAAHKPWQHMEDGLVLLAINLMLLQACTVRCTPVAHATINSSRLATHQPFAPKPEDKDSLWIPGAVRAAKILKFGLWGGHGTRRGRGGY